MGHNSSTHETPHTVRIIHGKLQHHAGVLRRIATMTYTEFLDSVTELNRVTSSFTDQRGKQLRFSVKGGSADTFLWKGTVRVQCEKISPATNLIYSVRDLNIREYIQVYKEITDHVTNLTPGTPGGTSGTISICASMILDEAEHKSLDVDEECCICMENVPKVILPCTHRFCERCVAQWSDAHKTCPVCRADCEKPEDTWLLTDRPDTSEYESEVREHLVSIADRRRSEPD